MKKHLFLFLLVMVGFYNVPAQTLLEEIPEYKIQYGDIHDVDINADGHLDIFIGGNDYAKSEINKRTGLNGTDYWYQTILLLWNESITDFYTAGTNFMSNSRPYSAFADFDGDNILDMVYASHGVIEAFPDDWGLFIGDGNGNFNKEPMTFDNAEYEFFPRACAVADVNNDCKPDIIAIGYNGSYGTEAFTNFSAILINAGEYVGDMTFNVTSQALFANNAWSYPQIQLLDMNNDGYTDFIIATRDDSENAISNATFTDIFLNKGAAAPGEFERIYLCEQMGGSPQYLGPVCVQDFNSDGFLDVFVVGKNGSTSVAPMNLYLNNGDSTFTKSEQANFRADMRNENSTATQSLPFDWDGDGYSDIIMSGYVSVDPATQTGFWWKNDGSANFGTESRTPGASNSCMAFPDWDGDGVRDMMIIGKTTSTTYITQGGTNYFEAMITKGEGATNVKPSAPTNINAVTDGSSVTLSWDAATDDKTPSNSLSYEYYIKNSDEEVYNNCRSIIGGDMDGSRMVLALGNAFLSKSVTLNNLPVGEYTWGVQTIDACYEGSVFESGAFTISESTDVPKTQDLSVKVTVLNQILTVRSEIENARLKVMDITGRVWEDTPFNHTYSQELPKGIYIIVVEHNQKLNVQKTIIL